MKVDDIQNPSAFPSDTQIGGERYGLTLRDYFAAKAMQSLILAHAPQIEAQSSGVAYLVSFNGNEQSFDGWAASRSFELADAMLGERSKQPTQ